MISSGGTPECRGCHCTLTLYPAGTLYCVHCRVLRPCCRCCKAADERGELDHLLGEGCPHLPCDLHQPDLMERRWT